MKKETVFDVTHQSILETAKELFLTNGYKNTSTRDIAKAANITQPALYYHFSTKELLFVEINKQIGSQLKTAIEQIIQKNDSLENQLIDCTNALLNVYHRDIFSFIHQSAAEMEPENKQQLFHILNEYYLEPLQKVFETSKETLNSHVSAQKAAQFYLMSLSLLFSTVHQLRTENERSEQIAELMQMVLHGVVA
ncbi:MULTISPECIES: TetR/AcrR family transcriptional regulator [unclassified Enterococcus]|uniref:TetR/AcrR family transcriptional regulator n=1 Tax=unclassified Enterococcus TaxID=2608891 RepID=UPI001CE0E622|nr:MULTISPECIES: TetR/AcrR family transcriptional regulator [unclassified Enterococcus]MCA5013134.1 TetR/AcrR family transcriptional regulator [Enterococcus sp. S23]MCA5016384.1 TetR/AcrR family transcriptional regulator [Enterococcus sp. S22(2020)]